MISDFLIEIMNQKSNEEQVLREEKTDEKNVTDNVRYNEGNPEELEWLTVEGKQYSTYVGCGSYDQADDRCKELGGRLPTRMELTFLYDNLPETTCNIRESFPLPKSKCVWTSTSGNVEEDNKKIWSFGIYIGDSYLSDRYDENSFICVKDDEKKAEEEDKETVGVQWKKIEGKLWSTCIGVGNFKEAWDQCKKLGGRLPTRAELTNVFDDWSDYAYNIKQSVLGKWPDNGFDFWTVSRDGTDEDNEERWAFNLKYGNSYLISQNYNCYVICVKDIIN